ncbi:MAG TPA: SHOCT domain-containing protein [Gammaproteobacteria bacterium]|nr:SHOCT domain-containing protein [Gammaproteobacteria bacterium]
MWQGHGYFGGGFMWLFWILLVVVAVWGVSAVSRGGRGVSERRTTPLEILKERYARGEIDKEEFEAKRKDLLS